MDMQNQQDRINKLPTKPGKWVVMYMHLRGIDFTSIYNSLIGIWKCSDSVVFFVLLSQKEAKIWQELTSILNL
jgi:hypothetical protein